MVSIDDKQARKVGLGAETTGICLQRHRACDAERFWEIGILCVMKTGVCFLKTGAVQTIFH